ncbi:MAG: ABC transporter permease [Candidatus Aureabacteria bacterium]|nr:ABC transporter permease [Candidatus Auribacterota bacterium]
MIRLYRRLKYVVKEYGELILTLAVRNLKVQYKHAFLGFLWSLFVPLIMMLVFWFVFGFWFKRGEGIGPLFLITALFPWTFVQMSVSAATTSIVDSRDIIRKVYFPKEVVPFSVVASNFFNFSISMGLMVVLFIVKRTWCGETHMITVDYLYVPLLMLLTATLAAGVGLLTACGQVYFRDVRYLVEVGLMVWFYFSPIFYLIADVKAYSTWVFRLYMLNPLAALITLYRTAFQIGSPAGAIISIPCLTAVTAATIMVIFIIGYSLFIWREKDFVDLV